MVGTAVSPDENGTGTRQKHSGKSQTASSGKLVANPEVESSGKSLSENLPLTDETDTDIELGDDIDAAITQGWRLEENSNGYWRWRFQEKDDDGNPITYVNSAGGVVYKRGSHYVGIETVPEIKRRLEQDKRRRIRGQQRNGNKGRRA